MYMVARNIPSQPWYFFAKAPTAIAFLIVFALLADAARRSGGLAHRAAMGTAAGPRKQTG
jgi:hypothetical protein